MRRSEKELPKDQVIAMLNTATNGVLAISGDDGYPYAVPMSFAYVDGKLYFHSTTGTSHKLDGIANNPKVSFCVVTQDNILPAEFNTHFKSAIAFGTARVLTDEQEIMNGIMAIAQKYSAAHMEKGKEYAQKAKDAFCVVEITIDHLTGKIGK
ncbi:pyridoxamine 5'-phosphate oxidase family protein [Bengtsoniella intestinalis]